MSRYSQPNLIRVGPGGQVEAVFPGGLILPVTVGAVTVGAEQRIDWQRTSDGARVATIFGREGSAGDRTAFLDTSAGTGAGDIAETLVGAGTADDLFPTSPRLRVFNVNAGNKGIDCSADGTQGGAYAMIMDAEGRSEFVQTSYGLASDLKTVEFPILVDPIGAVAPGGGWSSAISTGIPIAQAVQTRVWGTHSIAGNGSVMSWAFSISADGLGNIVVNLQGHNPSGVNYLGGQWYGGCFFQFSGI